MSAPNSPIHKNLRYHSSTPGEETDQDMERIVDLVLVALAAAYAGIGFAFVAWSAHRALSGLIPW